jgi:hypothetical protein
MAGHVASPLRTKVDVAVEGVVGALSAISPLPQAATPDRTKKQSRKKARMFDLQKFLLFPDAFRENYLNTYHKILKKSMLFRLFKQKPKHSTRPLN